MLTTCPQCHGPLSTQATRCPRCAWVPPRPNPQPGPTAATDPATAHVEGKHSFARKPQPPRPAVRSSRAPLLLGIGVSVGLLIIIVAAAASSQAARNRLRVLDAEREAKEQVERERAQAIEQERARGAQQERRLREAEIAREKERLQREAEADKERLATEARIREALAERARWAGQPDPAGKPAPEPAPRPGPQPARVLDLGAVKEALKLLVSEKDSGKRGDAGEALRRALGQQVPNADVVRIAWLLLSRDALDAGFAVDRLAIQSPSISTDFPGVVEKVHPTYYALRVKSGELVTATKNVGLPTWTVQVPGGITIGDAAVQMQANVPTMAGTILTDHAKRLTPESWLDAKPEEHLRVAKLLSDAIAKAGLPDTMAHYLLRGLAASHAVTCSAADGPAKDEAERFLTKLGYVEEGGNWSLVADTPMIKAHASFRDEQPQKALGWFTDAKSFRLMYGDAAVRLVIDMRYVKELSPLRDVLERVHGVAMTDTESQHMLALKKSVDVFRPCSWCSGAHFIGCSKCGGKGELQLVCNGCNGHGSVQVPGVGGGTRQCNRCGGSGNLGMTDCKECSQSGRRPCTKCPTAWKPPQPIEIADPDPCPLCAGAGSFTGRIRVLCPKCLGLGWFLIPQANKMAVLR